ncbi:1-acyl-sn-glycerol-3-phosphate acyltransferase [Nitrosomonas sp.]|uniref:lysophospholipid acyltransferase family protein n=1 Tax=Nitrosomonas sp. TaxID=42353 RepID=UPI00208675BF|nr:lysophospholipid acyltransferase family protein [Nitrosomonas sp.]GJL76132.1 MAG: 1-acyl-sn-glycerol-3-phosphate acyltransferase [Nitrosomonas sp.]
MKKTTSGLVRTIRLTRLLFHVVSGIIQSIPYPYFSRPTQHQMMKNWAAGILKILCIKVHHTGQLPGQNIQQALFVANHVSWLDICLLMAVCPTQFVAKSEIRGWPVIGFLCKRVGTLFIKRAKRSDTMRINREIGNVLTAGERVCIFPEGATSNGLQIHHFHASLLQSAVNTHAFLYPVAIRYLDSTGKICLDAAYIDTSILASLKKILNQPRLEAVLNFNDAILCEGRNRRELARLSEQAVANSLSLSPYHKESEKPSYLPGA